jgi:hypothetical protein
MDEMNKKPWFTKTGLLPIFLLPKVTKLKTMEKTLKQMFSFSAEFQ